MTTSTTASADLERVHHAVSAYGDNPSGFLALSSQNSSFHASDTPGVIVYRTSGPFLVQFGGPFAPADRAAELLDRFVEFAVAQNRTVVTVQVQEPETGLYASRGFTVNQVGASYAVDLARFTLRGSRFMQLRNKVARAARAGLTVVEGSLEQWAEGVAAVDRAWLGSKGEQAKELEFLVGECGGASQAHRRLFLGLMDKKVVGYISYSPAYGSRPGWLHDLSRRLPDDSPGIMETLNKTAIETFLAEGAQWLHFGFTPFTSLSPEHEKPGASPAFTWFMHWMWENGGAVYPAQSQLAYKRKWAPHLVLPEYIAFQGPARASGLIHVFKASNAV
ncbi:bifunctional lysylphosphatidylglycerol flippase/synthetase MprF [Streptomyces sp. DB-54]